MPILHEEDLARQIKHEQFMVLLLRDDMEGETVTCVSVMKATAAASVCHVQVQAVSKSQIGGQALQGG